MSSTIVRQESLVPAATIRRVPRDGIFDYAAVVLNDGLLLLAFEDAIREGDGERILRCWRAMTIYFHSAGHANNTKEAVFLQALVKLAATPLVVTQLTWSRTMNTRGGSGKNVPVDLHNEHLNRLVKTAAAHIGAIVSTTAILQCGKRVKSFQSPRI